MLSDLIRMLVHVKQTHGDFNVVCGNSRIGGIAVLKHHNPPIVNLITQPLPPPPAPVTQLTRGLT